MLWIVQMDEGYRSMDDATGEEQSVREWRDDWLDEIRVCSLSLYKL